MGRVDQTDRPDGILQGAQVKTEAHAERPIPKVNPLDGLKSGLNGWDLSSDHQIPFEARAKAAGPCFFYTSAQRTNVFFDASKPK
jgi:hypothetical protein